MVTKDTAPAWRRGFLRALARGGNVTLAARSCGIDKSSAYQLRKRNAAFARSWERALEAARGRLSFETPASRQSAGPSRRAFETPLCGSSVAPQDKRKRLRLRGSSVAPQDERKRVRLRGDEVVRSSKRGRVCIVRAGPGRWSAKAEAAFLAELTASANVTAAARAAGISTTTAYNRRRLWPAFADQWGAAVAEGFARIETLLVCAATNTLNPEPLPERADGEGGAGPTMSMELAFNLYKLHRASQRCGKPQRYAWRAQEPDIEDVRAEILRKVAAMERAELPEGELWSGAESSGPPGQARGDGGG